VLVSKSRESMMAAVQIYNNPLITFKSESFIILSNIAWTYLLHAYYRSKNIDYRYFSMQGCKKKYDKTKAKNFKYWELERCINCDCCPLDLQTRANLKFLITIRHEIEHHIPPGIDDAIKGKIQASCINYNYYVKKLFGDSFGIDNELGMSIQFSEITPTQVEQLSNNDQLPKYMRNFIVEFESGLSDDEVSGSRYEYKIVYEAYCSSRKSDCDKVIQFKKCDGSESPNEIIHIKEIEKKKYFPKEIVKMMNNIGYPKFTMNSFITLWKEKNARIDPQYAVCLGGRWFWYELWINVVKNHCEVNKDEFG